MALIDYKITDGDKSKNQIRSGSAPDRLVGSADENKQVFDRLALLVADKHNGALDELSSEFATQNTKMNTINQTLQEQIDTIEGGVTPLIPRGMYATIEDLEEAHPTGLVGDAWLVGDETSNTAYIWDEDGEAWVDVGGLIDASGFRTAYNRSFESNDANIAMDGTADAGVSNNIPRADHVHPSDTNKANLVNGYVVDEELLDEETITQWRTILGIS